MLTHFSITQQGESHIRNDSPCQDFSGSARIHCPKTDEFFLAAAVSDGVGSCEFSQYGSEIAVTAFLAQAEQKLSSLDHSPTDEEILEFLKDCFEKAQAGIEADALTRELPVLQYDCTLTAAVYDSRGRLWFGHIGDDGLLALFTDGTCKMLSKRHKGQEFNSVYPLRNRTLWQFETADRPVASFCMMTDGVLDYCVDSPAMEERIFFPFLEPVLCRVMEDDEQAQEVCRDWAGYLSGTEDYPYRFRASVTDDISLVTGQNSQLVACTTPVPFDFARWEMDTQRRIREIDEALYSEFRAYQNRKLSEQANSDRSAGAKLTPETDASEIPDDIREISEGGQRDCPLPIQGEPLFPDGSSEHPLHIPV